MRRELRLLILEDSARDADLLERELRRGGLSFIAHRVETREAFVAEHGEFKPDLIISDYSLPSFDGVEALQHVRQADPHLPFILVSGYIGEERAIEAFKIGATDIILKDRLSQLVPSLRRAMHEVDERIERQRLEEMLRQSQKLEAVAHLTGGIAHDFNNLLAVIHGNLELIRGGSASPAETEEMLGDTFYAAERGANLTHQLLAFSRQQPLAPKVITPDGVIAQVTQLLRRTLGETIEIETIIPADLWTISADSPQLENALVNLAVNARDAMPEGGRLIFEAANKELDETYTEQNPEVAPGSYVLLSVSDSGSGMPEEIRRRVVEPFFTTKPVGAGSGLGLSMVFGFVAQSGGHLKIESELGKGTTINLFFPKAQLNIGQQVEVQNEASIPESVDGEVVLVVEDDPMVRKFAVRVLANLGYETIQAPDGPEALRLLDSAGRVDLLLTDVVLPKGMTGPAVAREARIQRPELCVLYMSGYPGQDLNCGSTLGESQHLLTKPFSKAELANKIRDILDCPNQP